MYASIGPARIGPVSGYANEGARDDLRDDDGEESARLPKRRVNRGAKHDLSRAANPPDREIVRGSVLSLPGTMGGVAVVILDPTSLDGGQKNVIKASAGQIIDARSADNQAVTSKESLMFAV